MKNNTNYVIDIIKIESPLIIAERFCLQHDIDTNNIEPLAN